MRIGLRAATLEDFRFVYDVTEATMRDYVEQTFGPWVAEEQKEIIGKSFRANTHQVVLVDGEPAGILAVEIHDRHLQLEKIYLSPAFQRQGVGTQLVKQLIEFVRMSKKPIRLRVLAANSAARRLYERLGFVVTEVTPQRVFMEHRI
jgi:ribosomal protein S18 acetylase RimI-like enzyme